MSQIQFTEKTRWLIHDLGAAAAQDMVYEDACKPDLIVKLSLGCNILAGDSRPEYVSAHAKVEALIAEHGWDEVKKAAARIVPHA